MEAARFWRLSRFAGKDSTGPGELINHARSVFAASRRVSFGWLLAPAAVFGLDHRTKNSYNPFSSHASALLEIQPIVLRSCLCECVGASHMSKTRRLGLGILAVGAGLGFVAGGAPGLAFAAVCLVVGFVMFVVSEARGTTQKDAAQKSERVRETARVLVLLKEVHARPQRNGKFQEIGNTDESGLEFEVFLNCWLLNETDLPLQIVEPIQLTIGARDGSRKVGERVSSDMENWRLGSLVKDEWNTDKVRAVQEKLSELYTADPLECGVPRQGWLHFRFRDILPSDFRVGPMELIVKDAMSSTHVGRASGPRHLPGKVWPCIPNSSTKGKSDAAGTVVTPRSITGNYSAFQVISKDGELEAYYWVVICKNRKFHEQQNIYSGHKIALCETDEFTPPPQMELFTVRCDECGENQSYGPSDLVRFQMPLVPNFKPHPLFADL